MNRFSIKEQVLFATRLSFLVRAGVPILESLTMLKRQTRSSSHGKIFDAVISDVSNGQFLSTSLSKFEHIFGNLAVNIIRVGETSGILSENLAYLANELKKKQALKRKIVGSLVYPIFVTIATLGITLLLTAYIFPKILPIFKSLNIALPFYTRLLIWTSSFIRSYGVFVFASSMLAAILIWLSLRKNDSFHFAIDRALLRIPIIGTLLKSYNTSNFCRTLGLLLKSSIPVVDAITVTARTTQNRVYRNEFSALAREVSTGNTLSTYLELRRDLFPNILSHMVAIGETTGNLSETLIYISELYENEVDEITKNMSSSIEPVLMIFMGIIVGFVAISVITPIYAITQNLHP
jgi:type IV pilus assembly protein PilC